jgi:hypothetical protein
MIIYLVILLAFCGIGIVIYQLFKKPNTNLIKVRNKPVFKPALKKIRYVGKNNDNNQHKAAMKARRQGHLRYYFHGEYYNTGLYAR